MATCNRVFVRSTLVLILSSTLLKTVSPCSPDPNKPYRSITELAILAPVVVVGRVLNISIDPKLQLFTEYSACLNVTEVIKQDKSISIPQTFCTRRFGTEAMCLAHVYPSESYVFYLDSNLQTRYDAHFSAVRLATDFVIQQARRGYCEVGNSTNCVAPSLKIVPNKLIKVDEGKSVVLTCSATGTIPFVVTWLHKDGSDSLPLYSNVLTNGSLSLSKMSTKSRGKYTCVVKNAAGAASYETRIVLRFIYCGGVFMANRRTDITSPNFPDQYPPDKTCVWRVCPPRKHRIKFNFNMFHLHELDSITIYNECRKSRESWRRYCGSVSPGEFVSRCKTKCVQLRMDSSMKYSSAPPFTGINVTVEPSLEKRTKAYDVLKDYCNSDLVVKGRYISHNRWPLSGIKIFALDSFKEPYAHNTSYDIIYKNKDQYGCLQVYNFIKDYFYFATQNSKGIFTVKSAIADDGSRKATRLNTVLPKYKNNESLCRPQK